MENTANIANAIPTVENKAQANSARQNLWKLKSVYLESSEK